MKYFEKQLPFGSELVLQAMDTFQVLRIEQLKLLLEKCDIGSPTKVINLLLNRGFIFTNDNGYVSFRPAHFVSSRKSVAAFWIYLEWAEKIKNKFSRGLYPAEMVFTINKTNYEVIICDDDGKIEIGHLAYRKKPVCPTKFIVVFQDKMYLDYFSTDNLPDYDFLFALVAYDGSSHIPKVSFYEPGGGENRNEHPNN